MWPKWEFLSFRFLTELLLVLLWILDRQPPFLSHKWSLEISVLGLKSGLWIQVPSIFFISLSSMCGLLHILKWLLGLQPSCLYFNHQEGERAKMCTFLHLRIIFGNYIQFTLQPISQNLAIWSCLASRETRICTLYVVWEESCKGMKARRWRW